MRSVLTMAVAAGLAFGLAAQDKPQAKTGPAQEAYKKLVADYDAAAAAYSAAMKELQATDEWKKALEAKDRTALASLQKKVKPIDRAGLAKRALHLAGEFTADDSVPFYCWTVLNSGDKELAQTAIESLRKEHMKSPALVQLLERGVMLPRLLGPDEGNAFLDEVIESNPDKLARAWAMYWRGSALEGGRNASDEEKARGKELLAKAAELAAGSLLADRIAAPQFERDRLQIGMQVPEIEGVDVDSTPFKLSDYRGKVVVLDFWGFW